MFKLKSLFFFLSLLTALYSQEVSNWKSHNSMSDVVDVFIKNKIVWAATNGGAFYYNVETGEIGKVTPSDGLSSPMLTSLAVDNNGNAWFGSQQGTDLGMVNVFDASTGLVKRITDIMNSDYPQKNINSITAKGDTIFVSTDFGLSLLDINSYTFYDTFIKFGQFPALSQVIKAYAGKKIYVATENGLAVQRNVDANLSAPESWITFQLGTDIPASTIFDVVEYSSLIIVATNNGVFSYDNSSWQQFALNGLSVSRIILNNNELYFIVDDNDTNSILRYNSGEPEVIYETNGSTSLRSLTVHNNSDIYAASSGGLLKISGGSVEEIIPEGPKNNSFISIDVDFDGTLWVGTGQDRFGIGIFSFDGDNWHVYDRVSTTTFSSNAFHIVYTAPDNTMYFGNWGRAFTTYKDGEFTNYYSNELPITGIPTDPDFIVVNGFGTDSKGNTWILNHLSASREPLSVLTTEGEIANFQINSPRINSSDELYHLVVDQYDNKWFSVSKGSIGLYYFNENGTFDNSNDDTAGRLTTSDGLLSNSIGALALDKRGNLWVGTNQGVTIIPDPSRPSLNIYSPIGLRQQTVSCIEVDALNRKWVGTQQGVFLMSEDGNSLLEHFNTSNSPIPTNEIRSIASDDKNGIIYIGTDFGLTSVQTNAVEPVESFDEIFVYPNPVKINDGTEPNITIDGLVENSQIKILSVSGKLVRELSSPGGKIAFWNGKDDNGNFVPSGIYIIVAYDEDGSNVAKSKVAVLRE